eukprot:c13186_g2_i1 orf=6-164(-)
MKINEEVPQFSFHWRCLLEVDGVIQVAFCVVSWLPRVMLHSLLVVKVLQTCI